MLLTFCRISSAYTMVLRRLPFSSIILFFFFLMIKILHLPRLACETLRLSYTRYIICTSTPRHTILAYTRNIQVFSGVLPRLPRPLLQCFVTITTFTIASIVLRHLRYSALEVYYVRQGIVPDYPGIYQVYKISGASSQIA